MPLITSRQVAEKNNPETIFTIVFCCTAGLIVLGCTLWLFAATTSDKTWVRKSPTRRLEDNPSKDAKRYKLTPKRSLINLATNFSTEAVPRQCLSLYDPRYETPFPRNFIDGVKVCTPTDTLRAASAPTGAARAPSSNGLFTPVKHAEMPRNAHSSNPNRVRSLTAVSALDSVDARNFILAVPEPLVLNDRPAGRPAAVTKHLIKYGRRNTCCTALADRDLHPNKLLSTVLSQNTSASACSSTSMKVAQESADLDGFGPESLTQLVEDALQEKHDSQYPCSDSSSSIGTMVEGTEPESNQSLTAMNRLKSYRSLTGSQMPKLGRSGTLTRPKTPVEEMRKKWDGPSGLPNIPTIAQNTSSVTLATATDAMSFTTSITTPPATPLEPSPSLSAPSNSCCDDRASLKSGKVHDKAPEVPVAHTSILTSHNMQEPEVPESLVEGSGIRMCQTSRRSRPAPLKLQPQSEIDSSRQLTAARSITYAGVLPYITARPSSTRAGFRASSMYSRDTHGFSIIRTPITPAFPSPSMMSVKEDEILDSMHKPSGSVKERISHWTQKIEGLTTPVSLTFDTPAVHAPALPPATPYAMTTTCDTVPSVDTANTHCNTDTRGSHGQNQTPVLEVETGSAPGGAKWI